MKVIKIKNIKNKEEILTFLIEKVKKDECNKGLWPLTEECNLPNQEYYTILDKGNVIPAYIFCENEEALFLWVDKEFRNKGYAKFLVKSLNIKYVKSLEISIPFWQSLGFEKIDKCCLKKNI